MRREVIKGLFVGGVLIPVLCFIAALIGGDVGGPLYWLVFALFFGSCGAVMGVVISKLRDRDS